MSKSVNKVILLGRAGKDPSVHILRTGTIVNLSLATSERYRDIHGDWQEHTEWHNLVGYQRVGEILRDMSARARGCMSKALCGRAPGTTGRPASAGIAQRSSFPRSASCRLRPMAEAMMWSTTSAVRALRNPSSARNRRLRRRKYPIDPSAE